MTTKIHHYFYALLLCFTFISATEAIPSNTNIPSDGTGETYISSSAFKNKKVNYIIKDNLAIYEGDIILGTVDEAEVWCDIKENTPTISRALGDRKKWHKGIVPYIFDADVSSKTRTLVHQAMKETQTKIHVSFVQRTKENAHLYADYIHIVSTQPACWSEVGRTGGEQEMNVVERCSLSGITHEFHHALGLFHYQINTKSATVLLQEMYGSTRIQKKSVPLKKSSSARLSMFTTPLNDQKIAPGQNFIVHWKNSGATSHELYYYKRDANNIYHRMSKEVITGVTKTLKAPEKFTAIYAILVSYENGKRLGLTTLRLLPNKSVIAPTAKPSTIIAPSKNMTVSSRQKITVKWKNNGADTHSISLGTSYRGLYGFRVIASNLTGTSKTIQMPTFFKSVEIILTSSKNGKRLGDSKVRLLPTKGAIAPTEFTSPVEKGFTDPTVKRGDTLTIKWESHGATREFLKIVAFDRQGYQKNLISEYVVGSGSKTITVPNYARSIAGALYSFRNGKSLGTSRIEVDVIP